MEWSAEERAVALMLSFQDIILSICIETIAPANLPVLYPRQPDKLKLTA